MIKLAFAMVLMLVSVLPAQAQTSFAPLVEKVLPSVVNVSTRLIENQDSPEVVNNLMFSTPDGHAALGSGFVVRDDGYIATNRHVIEQSSEISVITFDEKVYKAKVVGVDALSDIALLKINPKNKLPAVKFGNSDDIKVGDWVLAVGNPFGLRNSVSAGIISAKSRDIGSGIYDDFLQTDAAINQGNSGGPMFNMSGELIGINTAIFSDSGIGEGVGFALSSNQASWVVEQLMNNGKVERSILGITLKPVVVDESIAGLSVTSVTDALGELLPADIILEINGKPTLSVKNFSNYVSRLPVGTEVVLKLRRGSEVLEKTLKTLLMPEEQAEKTLPVREEAKEKGVSYPEFGIVLDDVKVVSVLSGSEADIKGIKSGDEIIKINGKAAIDAQNLAYYFIEAKSSGTALRLDLKDETGDGYFVELNPQGDVDGEQD